MERFLQVQILVKHHGIILKILIFDVWIPCYQGEFSNDLLYLDKDC